MTAHLASGKTCRRRSFKPVDLYNERLMRLTPEQHNFISDLMLLTDYETHRRTKPENAPFDTLSPFELCLFALRRSLSPDEQTQFDEAVLVVFAGM